MNPECAKAIQDAAGRKLTERELADIEARVKGARLELMRADRNGFNAKAPEAQYAEAVKLAKQKAIEHTIQAQETRIRNAEKKAKLVADVDSIKPGKNGQTKYLSERLLQVETDARAISGQLGSLLDRESMEASKGGFLGQFHDPEAMHDIARAVYGEPVQNPANAKAAEGIKKLADAIPARMQMEGIAINAREDYGMPQPLEPHKVLAASPKDFVDHMKQVLDPSEFIHGDGRRMTPDEINILLLKARDNIANDGDVRRMNGEGTGRGGGLFTAGSGVDAPRVFKYKNADGWFSTMQQFGRTTNMYDLLSHHIEDASKRIALAKTFGTNTETTLNELVARAAVADRKAAPEQANSIDAQKKQALRMFDAYVRPGSAAHAGVANVMANVRGFLTASRLTGLGHLVDLAGMKSASEMNGLPFGSIIRDYFANLKSNGEKLDFQHKAGIYLGSLQHSANQMAATEFAHGPGKFMSDMTYNLTFMHQHDRGMAVANANVFLDSMGKWSRTMTMDQVQGESRLLTKFGMTPEHWDIYKAADPVTWGNRETILTAEAIHNIPDSKLDPIIMPRVRKENEWIDGQLTKLGEANARENSWVEGRLQRWQERKDAAYKFLEDLNDRRQAKVDKVQGLSDAHAATIKAALDKAQVQHDIAARLKTEVAQDRILSFLEAVEEGAAAEERGAVAGRTVDRFGKAMDAQGLALGRKQAQAEARIKESQKRVDELQRSSDNATDAREQATVKRFNSLLEDIQTFANEMGERAKRRQDYADAFQEKLGNVLEDERTRAKTEAAEKLMQMAYGQMQFGARGGMPMTIADRIAFGMDPKTAGTPMGEVTRFLLQFKTIPLAIAKAHWDAAQNLPGITSGNIWGSKQMYLARFAAYSAMLGAVGTQLNALVNGQDPRNMNPMTPEGRKFAVEAMARGGPFGPIGDILLTGTNSYDQGLDFMLGPGWSAASGLAKEYQKAREDTLKGEMSNHQYGLAGVRWLRQNALPWMNVWYVKSAFNHAIYDQIQDHLSPGSSMKREMKQMKDGTSYWWRPGQAAPQRAPEMGKAFGDR